jgi:hypothetical protein
VVAEGRALLSDGDHVRVKVDGDTSSPLPSVSAPGAGAKEMGR